MSNFAFNNPAFQQQDPRNVATYPGAPQGAQGAQSASFQHGTMDAAANAQLEGMYAAPPAGAIETDRMSVEDTVWKTAGLFGILLGTAAVGWFLTLGGVAGLFIGGISAFFEVLYPGIVFQATLATVSVVGVTLALFASGKIRASKKATKIFMIAMIGYLVFSLLNVVLTWTGVLGEGAAFGLLSKVEILGIPLGLIIGVLVVIMAAYSLVLDFDQIQQGVRNGAPRKYGWLGAFGIMVTVVWLYVEILRIIAIARGNN